MIPRLNPFFQTGRDRIDLLHRLQASSIQHEADHDINHQRDNHRRHSGGSMFLMWSKTFVPLPRGKVVVCGQR